MIPFEITPAFVVVLVMVSTIVLLGVATVILWICGVDFNEKEHYRYQKMRKAQKRRRKALR